MGNTFYILSKRVRYIKVEHKYRLTGTPYELQKLLEDQFSADNEEAKLATYLLIAEQQDYSEDEHIELDSSLWYAEPQDNFTAPIFQTRYCISFSDLKLNLIFELSHVFSTIIFKHEPLDLTVLFKCLLAVVRSGTHIADNECCVYYQALQWKVSNPTREWFSVNDIFPHEDGRDGRICAHLDSLIDKKWTCRYCHDEKCTSSEQIFESILDSLYERKVFCKTNNMYKFAW